jgi:PAS domain S-box-containing protein
VAGAANVSASHPGQVALQEAEERARRSQALLERASALGHLGAWAIDGDSGVAWSKETLAILGYGQHERPRLEDAVSLLDPSRRAELQSALGACMREGVSFDLECMAHTVDNRLVWLRLLGEPDRDAHGRIVRSIGAVQDITAKKEAADRLQELTDRLTTTLESITDAFFTVDRQWRFPYVNGEAERLFGRSRDKLLGKVVWTEFPVSAGTMFHEQYKRALEESTTVKFEAWSDALARRFQVTAYPSVQELAVYFRDVTETNRIREALGESEERYRLLFHTSVDAIFETSPDRGITSANPAACVLFGRSEADLRQGIGCGPR